MRGARLYFTIAAIVLVIFLLVLLRSCRGGGRPLDPEATPERAPVSMLALPPPAIA